MSDDRRIRAGRAWQMADGMRGRHRPDEAADALLSALYVRMLCGPHRRWQRMVESRSSGDFQRELDEALQTVTSPIPLPRDDDRWRHTALVDAVREVDDVFRAKPPSRER